MMDMYHLSYIISGHGIVDDRTRNIYMYIDEKRRDIFLRKRILN